MTLFLDTLVGYDGNGSPIEFYYIGTKKVARTFDTKEEVLEYLKHYLNANWEECEKIGKLKVFYLRGKMIRNRKQFQKDITEVKSE